MEQDLPGLELQQQKTIVDQKKEVYVLELENSVDHLNQKLKREREREKEREREREREGEKECV